MAATTTTDNSAIVATTPADSRAANAAGAELFLAEYRRRQALKEYANEPLWLRAVRQAAADRFAALGFPTTRDEEWKYTSVAPIIQTGFLHPTEYDELQQRDLEAISGQAAIRLVFVDGQFAPELSDTDDLPAGVVVANLSTLIRERPDDVKRHLFQVARFEDQAFVALNTALACDGAHVFVPAGVVVAEPIHVVYAGAAGVQPVAAHPRNLYVAEANSQATIIETYWGPVGDPYFNNVVTEVVVGENAVLDHYKVQRESDAAYHVGWQQSEQARSSTFRSHNIVFGGALVRNDVNARLAGEGGEATLNGLYVAGGTQHVDTHTAIDHAMPHCASHELYKGVLDGRAVGVFNGKILVRQDAQKTDAKQTNQNLLLSDDAVINTKPQLEIYADDVRCTHGATVGQLDADALFYLRARGIGAEEARALLIHAFASDLLERFRVAPLRARLEAELAERLRVNG